MDRLVNLAAGGPQIQFCQHTRLSRLIFGAILEIYTAAIRELGDRKQDANFPARDRNRKGLLRRDYFAFVAVSCNFGEMRRIVCD